MSTVKDLVDEHFARALSTVATKERASPPLTLPERQPEHSPPNRGIKRKQDQMISPTHSTSSTPSRSPVPHTPTPLTTFNHSYPPPQQENRGLIVYPEFVQFLVHPDVDSFRDIPRLPGQSDRLACTPRGWQNDTGKDKLSSPPSGSSPPNNWTSPRDLDPLLLSPHTGPDLTREDLKAILELNDNVI